MSKLALVQAGKHWQMKFKQTYEFWQRRAQQPDFWGPAETVCRRFGVPPDLLIPLVYMRLNDRPEDPHVNFQSNVMRSEALMTRALRNHQRMMEIEAKGLQDACLVFKGRRMPQFDDVETTCRLVAELSLAYFRTMVMVKAAELDPVHHNPDNVPQVVKDSIAFRLCGCNPFFLAEIVEDPRLRHLAACNIQHVVEVQPWVFPIWEGLVRGCSLRDFDRLAGPAPSIPTFEGGQMGYNWPIDPLGFPPLVHDRKHAELRRPGLFLLTPAYDNRTDLYLAAQAERHRGNSA